MLLTDERSRNSILETRKTFSGNLGRKYWWLLMLFTWTSLSVNISWMKKPRSILQCGRVCFAMLFRESSVATWKSHRNKELWRLDVKISSASSVAKQNREPAIQMLRSMDLAFLWRVWPPQTDPTVRKQPVSWTLWGRKYFTPILVQFRWASRFKWVLILLFQYVAMSFEMLLAFSWMTEIMARSEQ